MDVIYPQIRNIQKGEHRCGQIQCSHMMTGHCRACAECKSPPFIINEPCNRCHECENVPNALRWDDAKKNKVSQEIPLSQEEKNALVILARGFEKRLRAIEKEESPMEIKR